MLFHRLTAAALPVAIALLLGVHGCTSTEPSQFGDAAPDTGRHDASRAEDARRDHRAAEAGPILGKPDAGRKETSTTTDAGYNDAKPNVDADVCDPDASAGPGPMKHICIIYPASGDDGNECDGNHDLPGLPALANGATGNGFDDNCNGLVDEGCACDAVGTTKPCYLVPASQTLNGLPVGWCAQNSVGTVDCRSTARGADVERHLPWRPAPLRGRRLRSGRFQLRREGGEPLFGQLRLHDRRGPVSDQPDHHRAISAARESPARGQRRPLVRQPGRRRPRDELDVDADRRRLRQHPAAPDVRPLRRPPTAPASPSARRRTTSARAATSTASWPPPRR